MWNQIRVDKGREWYLMLFIQQKLSLYRSDPTKPAFLQTSSTQVTLIKLNAVNSPNCGHFSVQATVLCLESVFCSGGGVVITVIKLFDIIVSSKVSYRIFQWGREIMLANGLY